MDISGKIIVATEVRSGESARTGSKWMARDFVIETHEQYPKRCVFSVFGEDRLKEFNIQVGEEVTVSFDIDAREYNGRWFNNVRAWRVQHGVVAPQADAQQQVPGSVPPPAVAPAPAAAPTATAAAPAPAAPTAPAQGATADDLPF